MVTGAYSGICPGGLTFFFFPGGAQHPLGHENPLKSIDFTGPGGALAPIAPPLNKPPDGYKYLFPYTSKYNCHQSFTILFVLNLRTSNEYQYVYRLELLYEVSVFLNA